jgi:hypothetical protein
MSLPPATISSSSLINVADPGFVRTPMSAFLKVRNEIDLPSFPVPDLQVRENADKMNIKNNSFVLLAIVLVII